MALEDLEALEGHRFPGGRFTIAAYEDWLMRDVIGAPRGDGVHAHPIWGFAAPQGAMGLTIGDVFALCDATAADGPMLGDTKVELTRPFRIGAPYVVSGGIVSAVRKTGRTAGVFDLVHFTVESADEAGSVVARLTNSFAFPRRTP
jgi:hypothetical protein